MTQWKHLILTALAALFPWTALGRLKDKETQDIWQINFPEAVTPVMRELIWLHDYLMVIITAITLFVLALLAYVCVRFRESANPTPSKTTHNTRLEIIWTGLPVLILVAIAIPSLQLLYFMDKTPKDVDLTLKVVGNKWYWTYEYPDYEGLTFDSVMVPDEELKRGQPRLLAVDNRIVVPVNATVRVLVTASDVLHAWAVPAFGVKIDAIPGHLNETWFRAEKEGVYYGQCSELCGEKHGFMPIAVEVVSQEAFDAWIEEAKQTFASSRRKRVHYSPDRCFRTTDKIISGTALTSSQIPTTKKDAR